MTFHTYAPATRDQVGLSSSTWATFVSRLEDLTTALEGVTESAGIEEDLPHIDGDQFQPGGWVGEYVKDAVTVEPNPDRISESGYQRMLERTQGWIETLGPLSAQALEFAPETLLNARTQYAEYSAYLIELTEQILASRAPVEVRRKRSRQRTLTGRPVFKAIQQERARQTGQLISETVEFAFDNPQTRLLTRFHAELQQDLRSLRRSLGAAGRDLDSQLGYHESFLDDGLPVDNLEPALRTDFDAADTLSTIRSEADSQMNELVDLWEAYRRDQARKLDSSQYRSCLKPLSKAYELWLLAIIVEYLSTATGNDPTPVNGRLSEIRLGDIRVYHDTTRAGKSDYVASFLQPGSHREAGKPDFMISRDREIRWVGEAKCRPWINIRKDDAMRFLAYVVDYLSAEGPSAAAMIAPNDPTTVPEIGIDTERNIEGHPTRRDFADPAVHDRAPDWMIQQFRDTGIVSDSSGG